MNSNDCNNQNTHLWRDTTQHHSFNQNETSVMNHQQIHLVDNMHRTMVNSPSSHQSNSNNNTHNNSNQLNNYKKIHNNHSYNYSSNVVENNLNNTNNPHQTNQFRIDPKSSVINFGVASSNLHPSANYQYQNVNSNQHIRRRTPSSYNFN